MNNSPIRRHLVADPFPWALWLLARRSVSKLKSACLGWLFGARGLYLGPGCSVMGSRFIRFGANLYAHRHLWLEALPSYKDQHFQPSIEIGDDVSISERVHISSIEHIHIGHRVLIGSGVYIGDHQHGTYNGAEQSHPDTAPASRSLGSGGPVLIGDDVWIGDNTVIVGPVSIGRGSIIGANSVVRRNIPEHTVAAGAPARPIKRFNEMTHQWETIDLNSGNSEVLSDRADFVTRHVSHRP
jgi:lipopolysaccharide O-acetyltransferase